MKAVALQDRVIMVERQRNVAVFSTLIALICVIVMTMAYVNKRQMVVLVPTTVSEYQVTKGRVSDDYLIAVTRDASSLLLNRHPHDSRYFKDNILRLVEPSLHEEMTLMIEKDDAENRFKAGRRNWMPRYACRVPGESLVTEVSGDLETYINGKSVDSRPVEKRFVWRVRGTRLYLLDVIDLEPGQSVCEKLKGAVDL